ncbi:ATP-binding cassette domain-containing protein [Amorphus sp. 3PC139-8]|uniref:branched-chain amino acid ABC transporter ATP-binding protein/permease n=1 Tax=Amorphus sp. 3PC139-8 TaxID=2735676 RepID=UPI00345D7CB2
MSGRLYFAFPAVVAVIALPLVLPFGWVSTLGHVGLNAIVCTGLVLLAGVAGITSFGQAAFAGLGAYTTAYLTARMGFSPFVTLPVSLLVAGAVGWVIGAITIRLSGHYLVLATLAWGLSLFYLFGSLPFLGGFNGISEIPSPSVLNADLADQRVFTMVVWACLLVVLLGCANMLRGRTGRAMRSLRFAEMAESMGVDTNQLKLRLFVIAAILASLAGWLQAHFLTVVAPSSFSVTISLDYLFMTVLGGAASLVGAVAGPFVFEFIRSGLREGIPQLLGVSGNFELLIFGIIMIVVLHRARSGVSGLVMGWLPRSVPKADPSAQPLDRRRGAASGEDFIKIENVTKMFGGFCAVKSFDATIRTGEILGLIGPNGAGKSTLFNLITGVAHPTSGRIEIRGEAVQGKPARIIAAKGVSRTFQHVHLQPDLTVLENVALGAYRRGRAGIVSSVFGLDRHEEARMMAEAQRQLDRVGLGKLSGEKASVLALGQQRLVEIARALASDPIALLLDEPAAGLRHQEREALGALLRQLKAEGMGILIVEHDMNFIMNLTDRLIVLEFGSKIAEGTPDAVRADARVIEAYLGPAE